MGNKNTKDVQIISSICVENSLCLEFHAFSFFCVHLFFLKCFCTEYFIYCVNTRIACLIHVPLVQKLNSWLVGFNEIVVLQHSTLNLILNLNNIKNIIKRKRFGKYVLKTIQ